MGAYSWMDIALGSDTGGSIRGPSQVNGCFGLRPSWGLVSLDHVMPLSPSMDTAGFLCRDPVLLHTAANVLYGDKISNTNFKSFPTRILTSGFPTTAASEGQAILLDFLSKLQTFLGATNTTALNLNTLWAATKPANVTETSISTYMGTVYPILIAQQQWTELTLPFYSDYAAKRKYSISNYPFSSRLPQTDSWFILKSRLITRHCLCFQCYLEPKLTNA